MSRKDILNKALTKREINFLVEVMFYLLWQTYSSIELDSVLSKEQYDELGKLWDKIEKFS